MQESTRSALFAQRSLRIDTSSSATTVSSPLQDMQIPGSRAEQQRSRGGSSFSLSGNKRLAQKSLYFTNETQQSGSTKNLFSPRRDQQEVQDKLAPKKLLSPKHLSTKQTAAFAKFMEKPLSPQQLLDQIERKKSRSMIGSSKQSKYIEGNQLITPQTPASPAHKIESTFNRARFSMCKTASAKQQIILNHEFGDIFSSPLRAYEEPKSPTSNLRSFEQNSAPNSSRFRKNLSTSQDSAQTSKFSQAGLMQFLQKAQILNDRENKRLFADITSKTEYISPTTFPTSPSASEASRRQYTQIDTIQIITLDSSKTTTLFFPSHNFYYFAVAAKSKPSPFKLTVKYDQAQNKGSQKLKGFISKTSSRPNTFNSDQEFDGRSFKLNADSGKKNFHMNFLYFSLYPEFDMTVKIRISFGEQKLSDSGSSHSRRDRFTSSEGKFSESSAVKRDQEAAQSQAQMVLKPPQYTESEKQKLFSAPFNSRDILQVNKFNIQDMFDKYSRSIKMKEGNEVRKLEVQERKNQLSLEKCQDVEEKHKKSSMRSQLRTEKRKIVEMNSKFQLWQLVWIKIIKQATMIQSLNNKIHAITRYRKVCHQAKFIVIRTAAKLLVNLRKAGKTPEKRAICMSGIVVNKLATMLHKRCTINAGQILIKFLSQSQKISDVKTKGILVLQLVINIQRQWRETKLRKKRFKELITKLFQQRYSEYLFEVRSEYKRNQDPFYQPKTIASGIPISKITDFVLLAKVIQDYSDYYLRRYYEMYENYRRAVKLGQMGLSDEVKKNLQITNTIRKPQYFRLPRDFEVKDMVRDYAIQKQLIN